MNNKPQEGSGSAENKGGNRSEQQQPLQALSDQQKQDIENEIGTGAVVGLHDLGQASGRDDASGGSGDRMEDTSTGEPTDRF